MKADYRSTELAPANNQLAAWVIFTSDAPVYCTYTVLKRETSTTSEDFYFSSDSLITPQNNLIKIPVIGLYANYLNIVNIVLTDQSGAEVYNGNQLIDTRSQTYRDATIFHLDIEKTEPVNFSTVWGNSWLMTTNCDGYDRNGDLRCYYETPYRNEMLKTHDGYFYIGSDEDEHWYGRRFFKIDILGNVIFEFDLRDSNGNLYCNTHDLIWDSEGYIYMVGNDYPDRSTNTMRQDAWILKFSDKTGKMVWGKNYTNEFNSTNILNNSPTNDVHINSLSWIPAGTNQEAIIAHSRSTSITFGVSTVDGSILWSVDTGNFNQDFQGTSAADKLNTSGITDYENGAHTVFVTTNSKFAGNTDFANGKFVLSLFNNNSCESADGSPVYRPISDDATSDAFVTNPAEVLFYAVDLQANTVTQVATPITLPSSPVRQITDFMGAVFEHGEYYGIYTNLARSFFISDVNGKIFATVYDVICSQDGYPEFPGECYRARLFSGDELADLVQTAF